jgi:GNAT superfamily N-acetyltransferase
MEIVNRLRRTPLLVMLQMLLRLIPFRPVEIGKLCFLRFDGIPRVPKGMLRGPAQVRLATEADVPGLTRLQDRRSAFLSRFAHGDLCVVAMIGSLIVGYEWFSEAAEHVEAVWGLTIAVPRNFVYAYDGYVDAAYRNSGIWLRFKGFLGEWMSARGKSGVLTFVDYGNFASLNTHRRFGFVPSSTVFAVKAFGRTFFKQRNLSDQSRSLPPLSTVARRAKGERHAVPSSQ